MPEFVTVATIDQISDGTRIVVEVNDHYIAIFNVGGALYAIEDVCTHDNGPLAEGELDGLVIECPRHGARFELSTGKNLSLVAPYPVPRYDVRVEGEHVQIAIG